MSTHRLATAFVVLVLGVAALSGCAAVSAPSRIDGESAVARPAALDGLPEVRLLEPGSRDAGTSPVFRWDAVDGAASYLLTLVVADGPLWAWQGGDTAVRLGGYTAEPAAGAGALRLTEPGWWSVSAFGADGGLLAVSPAVVVSPDDRVPASVEAAVPEAAAPADVCDLLTEDEVVAHLGGDLAGPGVSSTDGGGRYESCEWERADSEFATLRIGITSNASKASWDESIEAIREAYPDYETGVPGLDPDSTLDADWGGIRVQSLHGTTLVSVSSGMAEEYAQEVVDLAVLVLARLDRNG